MVYYSCRHALIFSHSSSDGGSLPQNSDLAAQVVPASPTLDANQIHLNPSFSPCGTAKNSLPVLTEGSCDDGYFDEFMSSWRSCLQHKNDEKLELRKLATKDDCATLIPVEEVFFGRENGVSTTTLNFLSEHVTDFSDVPTKGAGGELEIEFSKNDMEKVRRFTRYSMLQ